MNKQLRKAVIAGNWKMNKTPSEAKALLEEIKPLVKDAGCDVVVCVPYVDLCTALEATKGTNIGVGAENCHWAESGAFTGEISAGMLHDIGMSCAIVGHSERRTLYGETDNRVAMKALALVKAGLKPVVCVGETLEERETGATPSVILRQLNAVLTIVRPEDLLAVAYEPVWAIGTGKTATPEIAQSVHALIRTRLVEVSPKGGASTPILYGGSVKPENAHELFAQPDIDGALVGGAALKASSFLVIANAF